MAAASEAPNLRINQGKRAWLRQYVPLSWLVVALLISVVVLPSALNLPQANPTTLLEYAPVPPSDDSPPSNDSGSFSSLGLGSSSGLTTGAAPIPTSKERQKSGKGVKPITKRCVGKPLRQTEDPNSPPCVPFFDGENGGETWQGVTGAEIKILVYYSAYQRTDGETSPFNEMCDVDKPPDSDPGCVDDNSELTDVYPVKAVRALSHYFNDRFQTYDRRVHFYIYFSGAGSAAERRADAAANWEQIKPFAVIDEAFFGGFNGAYQEAMASRRVSVYGSFVGLQNQYYRDNAPMIWSFWPDIEHMVDMFVSFVCTKVAPFPVTYSGNPADNGKPRRYAIMYTTDPDFPGLAYFAQLAKLRLQNCPNGAKLDIAKEVTYSRNQYQIDASPVGPQEARTNVATMRGAGVTTILWLQGYETFTTTEADANSWYPEWVFAGDQLNDGIDNARAQNQKAWGHAWGMSNLLNEANPADRPCSQAFREADPTGATGVNGDQNEADACTFYRDIFSIFKSVQVAGPDLSPSTVDQGNHAIPRYSSSDPRVSACFYDPDDYTCTKDAQEIWWDPTAPDPEQDAGDIGCYRMVNKGKRYLAETWPGVQEAFGGAGDPCNTVDSNTFLGLATN